MKITGKTKTDRQKTTEKERQRKGRDKVQKEGQREAEKYDLRKRKDEVPTKFQMGNWQQRNGEVSNCKDI